jgi:disulfide bond formation protein DsbB
LTKSEIKPSKKYTKERVGQLLFVVWIIALISTLGALFIGEVMGQMPCLLCWYQRIAMFPLAIVLMIASYSSDAGVWRYTLPLAAIGGLIAAYHSLLYMGIIPKAIEPCGTGPSCSDANMTILGNIPIPLLSLGAFGAIIILLLLLRKRNVT